jgi:hypothetical protein
MLSTDVPDMPRTSRCVLDIVQNILACTLIRLCFKKLDEILFVVGAWGANVDQSGVLPTVFIVHHPSGTRCVGNPLFVDEMCGDMGTIIVQLCLHLMHVILMKMWFLNVPSVL